jgi:hypothetical protein
MARLTIEQIKAPDLSVASAATARAGESFQRGMSSASDLLSKYQEGLEAQGDAELTNLLAGAKNEDEWNNIVASTDFSKMNISQAMRENIMNRRDNILGYEKSRADTGLVGAQTNNTNATAARTRNQIGIDNNQDARAQDIHGVTMTDHRWRQGARAEDAALAGAALRSAQDNLATGGVAPSAASGLRPENTSGLVGAPGTNLGPRADGSGLRAPDGSMGTDQQIAYRNGIAAIESDGSGGYEAVGATHEEYGRALGRYQIMEANIPQWSKAALGREVSVDEFMANPAIQDAIFDHRFGQYVEEHGEEGAARAWFGGEGGINNVNGSDVHGRLTIGDYGSTFVNNIGGGRRGSPAPRQAVTVNPNQGSAAQQAYLDQVAARQYGTTAGALAALDTQRTYAETGRTEIAAADQKAADEALAQQLLDASRGNVSTTDAIVEAQRSGRGATAAEELRRQNSIIAAAGEGGPLDAARLSIGTTGASPEQLQVADAALADIQERQNRDPFQHAQNAARSYVDDPIQSLSQAMEQMEISTVPSELEGAVNKLANDLGISRAEAAYSFARAAEENIALLPDWSWGGDNLAQNRAKTFAREHFTGDNAATARASLGDDKIVIERIETVTNNLGKYERQIQKLRGNGETVPPELMDKRNKAEEALQQLYQEHRAKNPNAQQPAQDNSAAARLSNAAGNTSPGMRNPNPQAGWNSYLYQ